MHTPAPSRIEDARRRLRVARTALVALAVVGFGAIAAAAKISHPATHGSSSQVSSSFVSDDSDYYGFDGFDYGSGSIGSGYDDGYGVTPSFRSSAS